jgi:hypothetical protein
MKFSLPINTAAYQKQFNYHLKKLYNIQSIIHTESEVLIVANITEVEKTEIENYYNLLNGYASFYLDPEFGDEFVAGKYGINEEEGRKYNHLITAKITNMVTGGLLTPEEAEEYSLQTYQTRSFLREGHWNSAYYELISKVVDSKLMEITNEAIEHIKNYVNDKYPDNFNIA